MMKSIELGADAYGDVFGRVLRYLLRFPSRALFVSLMPELDAWLTKELPGSKEVIPFATWPIRIAERLAPFARQPKRLATELRRLFDERAVEPSQKGIAGLPSSVADNRQTAAVPD
jgi:hypothetical protein